MKTFMMIALLVSCNFIDSSIKTASETNTGGGSSTTTTLGGGSGTTTTLPTVDRANGDPVIGEQLYTMDCEVCHGVDGTGVGSYPSITSSNDSSLYYFIKNGGTGMPSFDNYAVADVEHIGAYIQAGFSASVNRANGSSVLGQSLYANNCTGCHASDGTGMNAPGSDIRSENDSSIFNAVRNGSGSMSAMPNLTKVQIQDIAAFIGNGFQP